MQISLSENMHIVYWKFGSAFFNNKARSRPNCTRQHRYRQRRPRRYTGRHSLVASNQSRAECLRNHTIVTCTPLSAASSYRPIRFTSYLCTWHLFYISCTALMLTTFLRVSISVHRCTSHLAPCPTPCPGTPSHLAPCPGTALHPALHT